MGAHVESPQDVDRLMALTDPRKVFLLFDTGHAYYGGAADPAALLKKHVARVAHVHCKDVRPQRSEEHTSELQSPDHLVCRLLLEKKKKTNDLEGKQINDPKRSTYDTYAELINNHCTVNN